MRNMALAAVLAVGQISSAAFPALAAPPGEEAPSATQARLRSLMEAHKLAKQGKTDRARAIVRPMVESPAFQWSPPELRYHTWMLLYVVEDAAGNHRQALEAVTQATALPHAASTAWLLRMDTVRQLLDRRQAAITVTEIARSYPKELGRSVNAADVALAFEGARAMEDGGAARFALLDALFDAGWKDESSAHLWIDLALDLLARGNEAKAQKVVEAVTDPEQVIMLRIDRRFDPLADGREPFDVARAADAQLEAWREAMAADPRSLKTASRYLFGLLAQDRPQAALELADSIIAHARPTDGASPAYHDPEEVDLAFEVRARALGMLGRQEEAVETMIEAGRRAKYAKGVAIKLSERLVLLRRPAEALEVVADVDEADLIAAGWGELQASRGCAYAQLGDEARLAEIIADLRGRSLNAAHLQTVLLCAGDEEGGAALMIARLENPDQRIDALAELQIRPAKGTQTPEETLRRARRQALRDRPDVLAAVAKIGRIETFAF